MGHRQNQGASLSSIGSAFAVLLSIAAFGVSILEANTVRSAAKAEAWPFVDVRSGYNSEGFSYQLINKGVGPARIRFAEARYKGEVIEDLDQLIIDILGEEDAFSYDRYKATGPDFQVMSPRESILLFGVDWDDSSRRLSDDFSQHLNFEVCYCSIYNECWSTDLNRDEPTPVSRCPVAD